MKKQLLLLVSMFLSLAVNAQDAVEIDEEWSKFWHIVALKDDDPKPTGIKNINQNTIIGQHYYSLDGKRINQPQRGLNIIKMNDGTTRKVVVK